MFGDDYIFQHIQQQLQIEADAELYRNYVADALYAISGNGKMSKRYFDIKNAIYAPVEKRTAEEIKNGVLSALGV